MSNVTATQIGVKTTSVNGAFSNIAPIVGGVTGDPPITCDDSLAGHRNVLFEALADLGKGADVRHPPTAKRSSVAGCFTSEYGCTFVSHCNEQSLGA